MCPALAILHVSLHLNTLWHRFPTQNYPSGHSKVCARRPFSVIWHERVQLATTPHIVRLSCPRRPQPTATAGPSSARCRNRVSVLNAAAATRKSILRLTNSRFCFVCCLCSTMPAENYMKSRLINSILNCDLISCTYMYGRHWASATENGLSLSAR